MHLRVLASCSDQEGVYRVIILQASLLNQKQRQDRVRMEPAIFGIFWQVRVGNSGLENVTGS